MCYAKPGPRCSAHAASKLTMAKRALKISRMNPEGFEDYAVLRERADKAQNEYDATPAGIKELQRRIRDHHELARRDYRLRLEKGVALRKMQLAAIHAEDKGDIAHSTFKETQKYVNTILPDAEADREKIKNDDPQVETLITESENWTAKLTPDEIEAVAWFTSNGSTPMNRYVGGAKTESSESMFHYSKKVLEASRRKLDSALAKVERDEPVVVYRGMSASHFEGTEFDYYKNTRSIEENTKAIVENRFKEGSTFRSNAYMSTSIDPAAAQRFSSGIMLEILSKKAAPIVNVSAWDITEREMVLPRDTKYKVHKVIQNPIINGKVEKDSYMVQLIEED